MIIVIAFSIINSTTEMARKIGREVLKLKLFQVIVLVCLVSSLESEGVYQLSNDGKVHFVGYAVFRMVPTNDAELRILQSLAVGDDHNLDFWKGPSNINEVVDVMVPPEKVMYLEQLLIANKIPRTIVMYDVERYIENENLEFESPSVFSARDGDAFFTRYRNLDEIYRHIDELAIENKNITMVTSIGRTSDGKELKVIKIGDPSPNSTRPSIWIGGGIHAREWISPATVTYIATKLIEDYNKDSEVKTLVNTYNWYVMPVINPDGYEYSRSTNRMWRKNRRWSTSSLRGCTGTDLNRNWAFHWREGGSSANPCSDTFAGPEAFSEPESKAISNFILERKDTMIAFLDVHSYSQLWLTPWGWTIELPKDYTSLVTVAQAATHAISQLYGTHYRIGSSTNLLYKATGGADDWAHGAAGVKYSYTLELRDTGRYGFLLPSEQILTTGQETWAGIKSMAKSIKREL